MYQVEQIVDKKVDLRKSNYGLDYVEKTFYAVKWVGYGHDQNTWEPLEHLEYCIDLVNEFESKQKQLSPEIRGQTINEEKLKRKNENKGNLAVQEQSAKQDIEDRPRDIASELRSTKTKIINVRHMITQKNAKEKYVNSSEEHEDQHIRRQRASSKLRRFKRDQAVRGKRTRRTKDIQGNEIIELNVDSIYEENDNNSSVRGLQSDISYQSNQEELRNNRMIQQAEAEILGMRKKNDDYEFYMQVGSDKGWFTHDLIKEHYLKELCSFYEKHLEFN